MNAKSLSTSLSGSGIAANSSGWAAQYSLKFYIRINVCEQQHQNLRVFDQWFRSQKEGRACYARQITCKGSQWFEEWVEGTLLFSWDFIHIIHLTGGNNRCHIQGTDYRKVEREKRRRFLKNSNMISMLYIYIWAYVIPAFGCFLLHGKGSFASIIWRCRTQ